jgi:hypothetical protein
MAKKKRKPHKKPMRYPLSALDKFVYNAAIVVSVALCFGSILIFLLISRGVVFSDPAVIASYQEGYLILYLMPMMVFFAALAVFLGVVKEKKKPLFENESFQPQDGRVYIKETPVFSKEFWRGLSEEARLKVFWVAIAVILSFAFSIIIATMCLYPRDVLLENGEIKHYNSLNELTETKNIYKAERLVIGIGINGSKSGTSYYIELEFVYGDGEYRFEHTAFDDMTNEEILEYMLRLKSDFAGKCVIRDSDLVKALCRDRNFTETEKALVYELFDYND